MIGPWWVAWVLVVGLGLAAALRGAWWTVERVPMPPSRRRAVSRALPLVAVLVGVLYLAWVVERVLASDTLQVALGGLAVLSAGLFLARHHLLDALAGAVLRAGGTLSPGDRVRLDGVDGRIRWLGTRVVALETPTGDEVLLPYTRLARDVVIRVPPDGGAATHTFRLAAGDPEVVRRLVLLCHWASARRPALVEPDEHGLRVTVFALDRDRGPAIEAFVRAHLDGERPPGP